MISPAGGMGPPRRSAIAAIFALQVALLTIGIHRDYRLKHEDNNALHATFARSHLQLGFDITRAQNYFYLPATGGGAFYLNHPPGPGLVLAVVYGVTGHDGPLATRATAIAFHLLSTWLFYGLVRRVLTRQAEVVLATFLFAVLPESAFFGRMMNHEVLVLPAALLLVRGYWESLSGEWSAPRWSAAMSLGSAWAALSGWAGFFVIAACACHAGWEVIVRRHARARAPLVVLVVAGTVLFAFDLVHLTLAVGGAPGHLRALLASRMGVGSPETLGQWLGRVVELHWRYFGLTSGAGLVAVAFGAARGLRARAADPGVEVAALFLIAGAGYVAVFNSHAGKHDYWQFLLLPASALAIVHVFRYLRAAIARHDRAVVWRTLLVVAVLDLVVTTGVTLVQRHIKSEGYCLRVVEQLRRDHL